MDDTASQGWTKGDQILIKHVWDGQVRYAEPTTVVEDTGDRLILFTQAGTPTKWSWVDWDSGGFDGPKDHIWNSTDVLKILEPGKGYAIWLMWEEDAGPFQGWYIDLQDPFVRRSDSVVTWDRSLDIVVAPDGQWSWKDEDDFRRTEELGWISASDRETIRANGREAIQRIEAGDELFREPWPSWKPPRSWPIPKLENDWMRVDF